MAASVTIEKAVEGKTLENVRKAVDGSEDIRENPLIGVRAELSSSSSSSIAIIINLIFLAVPPAAPCFYRESSKIHSSRHFAHRVDKFSYLSLSIQLLSSDCFRRTPGSLHILSPRIYTYFITYLDHAGSSREAKTYAEHTYPVLTIMLAQ